MNYEDMLKSYEYRNACIKALKKQWEKFGIDENTSIIAENQQLWNEDNDVDSFFKRTSIPIAIRIMKSMSISKMVSVQPNIDGNCYYMTENANGSWLRSITSEMVSHPYRLNINFLNEANTLRGFGNLDAEAELCAIAAQEAAMELDRTILIQLRKLAAHRHIFDFRKALGDTILEKFESFYVATHQLAEDIERSSNKRPAWLITSPEVASFIETSVTFKPIESDKFSSSLTVSEEAGSFSMHLPSGSFEMTVYRDPLFPINAVLIGTDPSPTGYIWTPHILFGKDKSSFYHRSSFHMPVNGSKHYGTMQIMEFIV